jgi:hypothetical protein
MWKETLHHSDDSSRSCPHRVIMQNVARCPSLQSTVAEFKIYLFLTGSWSGKGSQVFLIPNSVCQSIADRRKVTAGDSVKGAEVIHV